MPTMYIRNFNLKDSLNDAQVGEYWRFLMDEVVPAIEKVNGSRSVKVYSGAGGLRADLVVAWEMDDAGVYERALVDPTLRGLIAKLYEGWDMKTAQQTFRREVTLELIQGMSTR